MKILFLTLIISTIYANDAKLKSSIFNMITSAVTKKAQPKVYLHTEITSLQKYPGNIVITKDCSSADIVVLSTVKNIPQACKSKVLFGTRYKHIKEKKVIGSFFWQKGRPNILFYQDRLHKNNIKLDSSFHKYIEK